MLGKKFITQCACYVMSVTSNFFPLSMFTAKTNVTISGDVTIFGDVTISEIISPLTLLTNGLYYSFKTYRIIHLFFQTYLNKMNQ